MNPNRGVLIYCEIKDDHLSPDSMELFGCGLRIADSLKTGLDCLLVGDTIAEIPDEAVRYGADRVFVATDDLLEGHQTDACLQVIEKHIAERSPKAILMDQTCIDLATRLAFRSNMNLTTGCTRIDIHPETQALVQTKPVHGSKVHIVVTGQKEPWILTVKPRCMAPATPDDSRTGEIVPTDYAIDPSLIRTKRVEKITVESDGLRVENAKTVVAGGRGIGEPDPFKGSLKDLADLFDGAVGCSRPPVDLDWASTHQQIGLTGKIVAPDVYFAIGISGSSQHMAGCSGAKTIIAINKDPDAHIFKQADLGVVGDYQIILPSLTQRIKELINRPSNNDT
ncbi:MAG: electron transfer flavoprotein subunit alpha/FixB family protein [Proteobacteria bacterium]|nr:electron transfer flavoprotein subunit alpha/FixB family protein [Pseudomonadota bacterium]